MHVIIIPNTIQQFNQKEKKEERSEPPQDDARQANGRMLCSPLTLVSLGSYSAPIKGTFFLFLYVHLRIIHTSHSSRHPLVQGPRMSSVGSQGSMNSLDFSYLPDGLLEAPTLSSKEMEHARVLYAPS